VPVLTMEEVQLGQVPATFHPPTLGPQDHAVYIFSSGTTGGQQEKVIMLTHQNLASNIQATNALLEVYEGAVCLTGVADNTHSFEHFLQLWALHNGLQLHFTTIVGFMKGAAATIEPHYLIMIPRAANMIMNAIKAKFKEAGLLSLLEAAVKQSTRHFRAKQHGLGPRPLATFLHYLASALLYPRVRRGLKAQFGRRVKYMIGGSAPLAAQTQEFFLAVGGENYNIKQGYGLTETSPVICVNNRHHYRIDPGHFSFGSSGRVIPGVEVVAANADLLQKNGTIVSDAEGEEGLLLVKGPNVFAGYYQNPQKTSEAFIDGWFNTQDRARIQTVNDNTGLGPYLYITGRSKDLIVFDNGQKLAPASLETYYEAHLAGIVSRFVCVGDTKNYLTAIIIPLEGVKRDIEAGKITKEDVCQTIHQQISDAPKRFGHAIRRVTLDLEKDISAFETISKKLKKGLYLQARQQMIEQLYR
ncbi:MAG: AMP-binding protein, partial [Pseudomonadota bacterium]